MNHQNLSAIDLVFENLGIQISFKSTMLKKYLLMYFIRQVEMKISTEYPKGLIRTPVHLCVGQEAVPVGLSENLRTQDKVLSYHRSHGHYLAKGGSLRELFGEILGKEIGCAKGRGGSQHLIDLSVNFIASAPILGGTVPIAAGVAFSQKISRSDAIVVTYVGDAVLEEGVFFETLSFASLHSLPILFVVENNRLSVHTPLAKRQPVRNFKNLGPAFGLFAEECDGNDIRFVSKAGKKHIEYVRKYKKPSILFFETFRRLEHVGPAQDFDLNYREFEEIEKWLNRDPLEIAMKSMDLDSKYQKKVTEIQEKIDMVIEYTWNEAILSEMAQN